MSDSKKDASPAVKAKEEGSPMDNFGKIEDQQVTVVRSARLVRSARSLLYLATASGPAFAGRFTLAGLSEFLGAFQASQAKASN